MLTSYNGKSTRVHCHNFGSSLQSLANLLSSLLLLLSFVSLIKVSTASGSDVVTATQCNREPVGISSVKTSGDNGFMIKISGNPDKYVPREKYTVTVHGVKTHASVQKFTGFMLVVESSNAQNEIENQHTGTFQLLGDALTKFSDLCPNAVVHTSSVLKSEIQVHWTAPPPGSGCVEFKITIVEHRDIWYMDDGALTKRLCEQVQENPDEQSEVLEGCKACDEAKYEVTFQGLWSRHTHPREFPKNDWSTHFSSIIGASHSPEYTMWEYGGIATDGLKRVAETGLTDGLEREMKNQSKFIRTIIKAPGLAYPILNGSTFAVFRVDHKHHLMSLVSMLGPSPDWIVGVSRLELCTKNNSWIAEKPLYLYPWDAGTDSGTSYMSPDSPTYPREPIRRITSSYPNNDDSPFYDPMGAPMKPVAKLTVSRQRVYHKESCDSVVNEFEPTESPREDERMECMTTDWTERTSCSAKCGEGIQIKSRQYINPMKAKGAGCNVQLDIMEKCMEEPCENNNQKQCALSNWSEWAECSVTCGKGTRLRSRKYLHQKDKKRCNDILMDRTTCMAEKEHCEYPYDPQCALTQWSEWSPCMVSCGKGFQVRTRIYLNPHSAKMCRMELMQKQVCVADKTDCNFSIKEAEEICSKPKDPGPCRGLYQRWYFDQTRKSCLPFSYGGCRGNRNNFNHYEQCNQVCSILKSNGGDMTNRINPNPVILTYAMRDSSVHVDKQHGLVCVPIDSPIVTSNGMSIPLSVHSSTSNIGPIPIDCMVTPWSPWSVCSVTCGRGTMNRQRMIKIHPQHGGKPCPKKLSQTKKCKPNKPCRK